MGRAKNAKNAVMEVHLFKKWPSENHAQLHDRSLPHAYAWGVALSVAAYSTGAPARA